MASHRRWVLEEERALAEEATSGPGRAVSKGCLAVAVTQQTEIHVNCAFPLSSSPSGKKLQPGPQNSGFWFFFLKKWVIETKTRGLLLFQRVCVFWDSLSKNTGSEASHLLETPRERPSETRATAYMQSLSPSHYKGKLWPYLGWESVKEDQFQHITLIRGSGFWKSTDHLKTNHYAARTDNAGFSFSSQ